MKYEATKWTTPLDEEHYNACNYHEYLKHKRFHHSEKGCEIKMTIEKTTGKGNETNYSVNKFCITHNLNCSKTGWELGWYLGECSKYKPVCQKCGEEFAYVGGHPMYCKPCRKIVMVEYCKARWERLKKLRSMC